MYGIVLYEWNRVWAGRAKKDHDEGYGCDRVRCFVRGESSVWKFDFFHERGSRTGEYTGFC